MSNRPDVVSGLIWVQTVGKGYQQTTLVGKELNIPVDTFIADTCPELLIRSMNFEDKLRTILFT